jgi:hypothetical protein
LETAGSRAEFIVVVDSNVFEGVWFKLLIGHCVGCCGVLGASTVIYVRCIQDD